LCAGFEIPSKMNSSPQLCPKCQQPLAPDVSQSAPCPNCGHINVSDVVASKPAPSHVGWFVFVIVLLLPALLTLLTARADSLWPVSTFLVGGVAALYCGFWLAWRIFRSTATRWILAMFFSGGFYVVSFFLCCAGCALGGAKLNFH
jgi:hypothetical protein